jgi:hypothetical protein
MAENVWLLASDASSYVTGQTFGGRRLDLPLAAPPMAGGMKERAPRGARMWQHEPGMATVTVGSPPSTPMPSS